MRAILVTLALASALAFSGCLAAGGQDPWAYTRKPLYAGGFDLERLAGESEVQQFRVTDGSIGAIDMFVWVNATAGGATVIIQDPSGKTVLSADQTMQTRVGLNLGTWSVTAEGEPASAGIVHVLVVRA